MALMAAAWDSWVPWEKFNLATSMPFSISRSSMASESLAGPIVQTILALRIQRSSALDNLGRTPNDALVRLRSFSPPTFGVQTAGRTAAKQKSGQDRGGEHGPDRTPARVADRPSRGEHDDERKDEGGVLEVVAL